MPKRKRKNEDGSKKEVKYKGVTKKREKRYQAQIYGDGKLHYLGMFDTAKKAARAYDRAAMQAGRPPTKLNYQDNRGICPTLQVSVRTFLGFNS